MLHVNTTNVNSIRNIQVNGVQAISSTNTHSASTGGVGTPSYTFINDTDTGIYSSTADSVDIACNGVKVANFCSAGLIDNVVGNVMGNLTGTVSRFSTQQSLSCSCCYQQYNCSKRCGWIVKCFILCRQLLGFCWPTAAGMASAPIYHMCNTTGNTNTGFYSSAADNVDVTCGGTRVANFASGGMRLYSGGLTQRVTTVTYSANSQSLTVFSPYGITCNCSS